MNLTAQQMRLPALKAILSYLFLFIFFNLSAQQIPIGTWRTHLSYSDAREVAEAGQKIYCATGNGLFYTDKQDNSVGVLTRINGLSDVEISTIAYDPENEILVIAYANTNIDLLINGRIINIPDIVNKNIFGKKVINSVYFKGDSAYLACGFGIVVLDLGKKEIRDTYYLGSSGSLEIHQVTINGDRIFAGTEAGVLEAPLNGSNLADYQNWTMHDASNGIPAGACTYLVSFAGKVFGYFSVSKTVKAWNGSGWEDTGLFTNDVQRIAVSHDKLLFLAFFRVYAYDESFGVVENLVNETAFSDLKSAIFDAEGNIWIADGTKSLVRYKNGAFDFFMPNGPAANLARRLALHEGTLVVAATVLGANYQNNYIHKGFFTFRNGNWTNYTYQNLPMIDTIFDIVVTTIDPSNQHILLGSFGRGITEVKEGVLINHYNPANSTLQSANLDPGSYRVAGMAFDKSGNLWVSNYLAQNPISVKRSNNTWKSYYFPNLQVSANDFMDLIVDSYNQKWVINIGEGIVLFKENASQELTYKHLREGSGLGNLPSNFVYALAEDKEGRIWVGTGKGIAVFYNPESMLQPNANIDAQPIKVIQDGLVQLLLETEVVTCIAIDGADRKWIGTQNGAWLFSSDGTQQILFFNEQNSPLLSNKINDIKIDAVTGEVFFATDKGIISYRGTATEGGDENKDVLVFPNPVRPGYTGLIAISGLVQNADVKITDINGNLVYQTIADGGQATWDGKTFEGRKVQSGVYLVFCTNTDGSQTIIQKILFMN